MSCECPICYEVIGDTNTTTTSCGHKFHTNCIIRSIMSVNNLCPCCRNSLTEISQPSIKQQSPRYQTPSQQAPSQQAPRYQFAEILQHTLEVIAFFGVVVVFIIVIDFIRLQPLIREHLQEHNPK
jgi:hypothetical protein